MKKMKDKKAQEEMVGFVLIVVIIAVIGVVFLGISLRNPKDTSFEKSYKLASFLSAVSEFTTECEINGNYKTINQLMLRCESGEICGSGKTACEELEDILEKIAETSYKVDQQGPISFYNLTITENTNLLIAPIIKGSCTENRVFNDYKIEEITMNFEVCYRTVNGN